MAARRDGRGECHGRAVRPWLGAAAGLVVLAGLLTADFLLPTEYMLIGYYAVAPLLTAATMGPGCTAAVGCLSVGAGLAAGAYEDHDLLTAQVLLQVGSVVVIAAIAVVVAAVRQRREEQMSDIVDVADTAQRAILRTGSMNLPGLRLASAYHSASGAAEVGGDLMETVNGPYGRRLILGDVAGKGLRAVRLAATVLGAFRLAALTRADLLDVAGDLDRVVVASGGAEEFVTALIAEFDGDAVRLISCGHHPPVLGPPSDLAPVEIVPSPPLGLGGDRAVTSVPWGSGDLLIAYTDGVVEARDGDGRMVALSDVIAGIDSSRPAAAVEHIAARVLRHTGGRLDDDLAVLAVARASTCEPGPTTSPTIDLSGARWRGPKPWATRLRRAGRSGARHPAEAAAGEAGPR